MPPPGRRVPGRGPLPADPRPGSVGVHQPARTSRSTNATQKGMMGSVPRPRPWRPDPQYAPVERNPPRPAGAAPLHVHRQRTTRPDLTTAAATAAAREWWLSSVMSTSDDAAPVDEASGSRAVTPLASVPLDPSGAPTDLFQAIDRHPCALVRHLDTYLAAVARELQVNGVLTAAPQRSDPAHLLIGSIVLDCTALRLAAWTPPDQTRRNRVARRRHPSRAPRTRRRDLGRGHRLVRRAAPRPGPLLPPLPAPRPAPRGASGRGLRRRPGPGPTPRRQPSPSPRPRPAAHDSASWT